MDRHLASLQKILDLTPIDGADKIECAKVLGWNVVVEKGKYSVGDLVIYAEVDSFLPIDNPNFAFLRKSCYRKLETGEEGYRIKTIRLRGQISQGIIFPILEFIDGYRSDIQHKEGVDVTELLKIIKYDPAIPVCLTGIAKGKFPSFIPKTDEQRIQSAPKVLERHKGKIFIASEKLDGMSITVYYNNGEFGICSRNLELKENVDNTIWKTISALSLKEKLTQHNKNISIQGEMIGPGIQKNKYALKTQEFRVFNIFNIDEYRYLNHVEMVEYIKVFELSSVPFVYENYILNDSIDGLVTLSIGNSVINPNVKREGLVFRPYIEERDDSLGRLSFKVINPEFLLKFDE